jgi:tetratricopeptide (TPR) repeat protein
MFGFDRSYIAQIELARVRPPRQLVEASDRGLDAGGTLTTLLPFAEREWDMWEAAGVTPTGLPELADPAPTPVRSVAPYIEQVNNHCFDPSMLEDPMLEAMEVADIVERTDVRSGTVDAVIWSVDLLSRYYPSTPAVDLVPRVRAHRRYVANLLGQSASSAQHDSLVEAAGWFTALLACLYFDLGERAAAEADRQALARIGYRSRNAALTAWSHEIQAWWAATDGRYVEAIEVCTTGLQAAPPDSSVAVQLGVQRTRCYASLKDRDAAERSLHQAAESLARLPAPTHPEHHFAFDPAKLVFYASTIYAKLGDVDQTERYARESIAQSGEGYGYRTSIAHLNLGIALVNSGRPSEAAQLGLEALTGQMISTSTLSFARDLHDALDGDTSGPATDFHARYEEVRRQFAQNRP